jgi:hypothetical protein
MTVQTYSYSTTLKVTSCGNCAIPFAIPVNLYEARLDDGQSFYCPNGHFIGWKAENEKAQLERQLKVERNRVAAIRAERDQVEASLRTTKGHVTRLRRKVLAGECPFCGQHLRDLERHIGRQHSDEPHEVTQEAIEAASSS